MWRDYGFDIDNTKAINDLDWTFRSYQSSVADMFEAMWNIREVKP